MNTMIEVNMSFNDDEIKKWSLERLKFEIETRRNDIHSKQMELADLRQEYNADPDGWGGSYPIGLDALPNAINKLHSEVEKIKIVLQSKL